MHGDCIHEDKEHALQDPVPRVGKLRVLYSRPGQRVLVDQGGDMQVRPTPLDIRLSSSNPGLLLQHLPSNTVKVPVVLVVNSQAVASNHSVLCVLCYSDGLGGHLEEQEKFTNCNNWFSIAASVPSRCSVIAVAECITIHGDALWWGASVAVSGTFSQCCWFWIASGSENCLNAAYLVCP